MSPALTAPSALSSDWQVDHRRAWLWAPIILTHLLLLWAGEQRLQPPPAGPAPTEPARRFELWLRPAPLEPAVARDRLAAGATASRSRGEVAARGAERPERAQPRSTSTAETIDTTAAARQPTTSAATRPASTLTAPPETAAPAAPSATPSANAASAASAAAPDATPLLDTAATRRAIRDSARQPGSGAQMAVEDGAALRAPTAEARLPGAMERSGKGDCAKGEYLGGGMGLLSLPFLAAAAIKGDCAK